jgi:hypothetical protein
MKFKPFMVLLMSLAAADPFAAAAQVIARDPSTQQSTVSTTISGTVLRSDRTTPADGVRLRLRKIDTNAIVATTTSGKDGTFVFQVAEPAQYMVEAIDDGGQTVLAVSGLLNATTSPLMTTVILSSSVKAVGAFFTSTAFLVVTAAGAAGIAVAVTQAGGSVSSPER